MLKIISVVHLNTKKTASGFEPGTWTARYLVA